MSKRRLQAKKQPRITELETALKTANEAAATAKTEADERIAALEATVKELSAEVPQGLAGAFGGYQASKEGATPTEAQKAALAGMNASQKELKAAGDFLSS